MRERDAITEQRKAFLQAHGGRDAIAFGTDRSLVGFGLPKASRSIPGLAWRFTHRIPEPPCTWLIFQPNATAPAGMALRQYLDRLQMPGPEELTQRLSGTPVETADRDGLIKHWILTERLNDHIVLWVPIPTETQFWRDGVQQQAGIPFHPSDAEFLAPANYAALKSTPKFPQKDA